MTKKKDNIPKRLMRTLQNMKQRCYNPKATSYKRYGGRGILICKEWLDNSDNFYNWALNNGYQDDLTIDRKDVNGNYEPDNCRWANLLVQANNRTDTVFIECDGEVKTVSQWSHEIGVSGSTIKNRFEKGMPILEDWSRIIEINLNGEIKTIKELSEESGIPYGVIKERIRRGWEAKHLTKDLEINETKYIEINGKIHTATEWAKISGLSRETILMRIQYGWKNEDLLKPKIYERTKKRIEIEGVSHTIDEWCEIVGISRNGFNLRIKKGLKGKELLAPIASCTPHKH